MTILSLGLLAQYFFSSLIIPILISFIQCFAKHLGTPCCVSLNILVCPAHSRSHCPFTLSVLPSTSLLVLAQPPSAATHPHALGALMVGAGAGRSWQHPWPTHLCAVNTFTRNAAAVLHSANTQEHPNPPFCPGVCGRGLCLVLPALVPEFTSPEGSFPKCLWCRRSWWYGKFVLPGTSGAQSR